MRVVRELRNMEVQFGGEGHTGWLPPGASKPLPTAVEIVKLDFEVRTADDGYQLVWQGAHRDHCGDTWHATIQDALDQAKLWFGIEPQELSTA